MKILVTGGYGMVGSAIDADIHFAREDCDLTDREKTEYWFKKLKLSKTHKKKINLMKLSQELFSREMLQNRL